MIRAFGDSITEGVGASVPAKAWRNVLAAALGQAITSLAHSGDMVADQTDEVLSASVAVGDTSIICLGVNDQRIYGSDAAKRCYFRKGLAAHVAWLALGSKVTARSVGNETGTWENTGVFGIGRCGRTAGAKKTFQVSGSTVYLSHLIQNGQAGAFDVRIDGVLVGSFVTAANMTTYHGQTYGPQLLRFAGLSAGVHTVEVEVTSAGRVYIEWVAGNDQAVLPKVYVGNVIKAAPPYTAGGSDANVDAYNQEISAMVAEFAADGLCVTLVDVCARLNVTSDLSSDGLHPSDAGHAKIAAAYQEALGVYTYAPVAVLRRSDGALFAQIDGEYKRLLTA